MGREILPITRRAFLQTAAAISAAPAWSRAAAAPSRVPWHERRDVFPEGVASGDPDSSSVLLWTRRDVGAEPPVDKLLVEMAEDLRFERVIAVSQAAISAASDWTCRVLVGGLKPSTCTGIVSAILGGRAAVSVER